jgi:hypothetical protein
VEKNNEFHTYKPRQERSFRVVLKNIHPSTDLNDIKESLKDIVCFSQGRVTFRGHHYVWDNVGLMRVTTTVSIHIDKMYECI